MSFSLAWEHRCRQFVFIYNKGGVTNMALVRSKSDRLIGGVCGGIAKSLGWDPTLVRITYVLASIFSSAFPGILVYIILWALMPEENENSLGVKY
jgi:phage shock protein PspC (stress-responsive transcriptional regulator)